MRGNTLRSVVSVLGVVVSLLLGASAFAQTFTVTVTVAPALTTEGATVEMRSTLGGPGAVGQFTYQWQKRSGSTFNNVNDGVTPHGAVISGSTSDVMLITNVGFPEVGSYRVQVTRVSPALTRVSLDPTLSVYRIRQRPGDCYEYVLTSGFSQYMQLPGDRSPVTIPDEATQQWIVDNMLSGSASTRVFTLPLNGNGTVGYAWHWTSSTNQGTRHESFAPTYFAWAPGQPQQPLLATNDVYMNHAFAAGQPGALVGQWSRLNGSFSNSTLYRRYPLVVNMMNRSHSGTVFTATVEAAGGTGNYAYQWRDLARVPLVDGMQPDGSVVSGATTPTITITNVTFASGFPIHVLVTSGGCETRRDFPINIMTPDGCDSIDFSNDGTYFDPADIDSFLSVFSEGPCTGNWDQENSAKYCNDVDINNDESVFDPMDIDAFLSVYSEGPCIR